MQALSWNNNQRIVAGSQRHHLRIHHDTDEMTCSNPRSHFPQPGHPNYRRHQDSLLNVPARMQKASETYRRIEQGVDSYALTLRLLQPEAGYQWYSIRFRSIRDETGRTIKLIGQLTNIHHQKLEEDRLRHEASTDLLTQIYNKITTEHLVSLELQEGRNHALIVVDLDKFKYANDTFGHLFGDSVIKAVAATLRATFRATDIVGRTGGDEFVVLAKDISLSDGLETLKAKCRRLSVELAHVSLGQDYVISASIGISLFPR
ncbi:MAG: GGDEF domain-containing protein, partial [Bilophila wadsworthia]